MFDLLTVVIPCKNEGIGIIDTIDSIRKICNSEIIISDCSTDNTRKIIKEFYPDIKIVNGGLPAIGRNRGFVEVKTKYVLFLDADMNISNIDMKQILNDMKQSEISLSTCKIRVDHKIHNLAYRLFDYVQKIISKKTPFAVGGFMLFESSEFINLGGFCELDKFAEDFHLSMKVKPEKFKIYNYKITTSNRRLKNKSIFYMINLMTRCYLNKNDDEFYKKDYNYWK